MESGGGIDMDEWRRRKREEEEEELARQARRDKLERDLILGQNDPMLQEMLANATPGGVAGSLMNVAKGAGNVLKYVPYLRAINPIARGAKFAAEKAKRAVWKPGTPNPQKPHIQTGGKTVPGTSGSVRPWVAPAAITAAELGGLGYLYKDEISEFLGASPDIAPGITQARVGPSTDGTIITEEPSPSLPFSPNLLEAIRSGGAKHHEGMPTTAFVPSAVTTDTSAETPGNEPSLWKAWGSLADNPKERKKAYLGSLKNIYMKKMLLDSIAKLTGGKSQGTVWANAAVAELDAIEKFDSEERLHNQWKALFFREDGTYDPPKNRKEAMERGGKLGYSHAQMKDILTIFPKSKSGTAVQQTVEYILSLPEGPVKKALMIKHGLMDDPKKDTEYAPGALEKNIEYLKSAFDFSDETIKKIIEMQVGLRAKAGTARDSKLYEYLYNIWRVEGKTAAGGVKDTHATFAIWLQSPAGQATVRALEGGQSSSNVLSEDDYDWGDLSS